MAVSAVSRPEVTPLHPESTPPGDGFLGLHWSAEKTPHTRRWSLVGRHPEGHRLAAVLEVRLRPGYATAKDMVRVLAQLANDYDEGAAALMAAALQQEEGTDGRQD